MVDQRGFNARTRPINVRHMDVGRSMPAGAELDLAYQTQRLAFSEKVTHKTYHFIAYGNAPIIWNNAGLNNPDYFEYPQNYATLSTSYKFDVPWLAHPNATQLKAVAYVAVGAFDAVLNMRLETSTLLSAVSTIQGWDSPARPSGRMPTMGNWHEASTDAFVPALALAVVPMTIEPDYPADRTLPFSVKLRGTWTANVEIDATAYRKAALMSLRMWDVVEGPDPET